MSDDYESYPFEPVDDLEEHDDENDEFWSEFGMPARATLRIAYENAMGEQSERVVDVKLFADSAWGPRLIGHCHSRGTTRTFSIDRIVSCVDEATGAPVSDVFDYLFDLYEQTPEYSFDQVSSKHIDTLRAAIHLANCTGLTEEEQTRIIRQICHQLSGDKRIGVEPISRFLSQYPAHEADGVDQSFRLIAGRLNKSLSPDNKQAVIRLCTKLAGLKGPINTASQQSLDYLAKRFAKAE